MRAAETVDKRRENRVDAGRQENGRGDNEEVLNDEVDDVVGILLRRKRARDVTDDFECETDREGGEVPRAMPQELKDVHDGEDEEEDHAKKRESERGGVAVDDDGRVVRAAGEGPVRVDIAAATVAAGGDAGRGTASAGWDAGRGTSLAHDVDRPVGRGSVEEVNPRFATAQRRKSRSSASRITGVEEARWVK